MTKINNTTFTGKEEGETTERKPNIGRVVAAASVFGFACYMIGFNKGHNIGYGKGVKDGIVHMSGKIYDVTRAIIDEIKKPEGE